ncbi:MAG: hypothetical protein WA532_08335 [Candidatus Korobacteraceae bacterium]
MSTAKVAEANEVAKNVIAILKSGALLKGIVRMHSTDGSMNIAWVAIELPVVGERQVAVKCGAGLQPGQEVVVECVPNPQKPGRYMFQMAESAAALNWLLCRARQDRSIDINSRRGRHCAG